MKTLGRALVTVLIAVGVLLVAVGAFTYWLVATGAGADWATARFLPDDASVERVEGSFLGPLTLHGVELRAEGGVTSIDRIRLDWRPRRLLRRTLHIEAVEVEGVTHQVREVDPPPEPVETELPDLRLPVVVILDRARIHGVRFFPVEAEAPIELDEVVVAASLRDGELALSELRIEGAAYVARMTGRVHAWDDYPLDLAFDWDARPPELPDFQGTGSLDGSLDALHVRHRLSEPTEVEFTASIIQLLEVEDLRWNAHLVVPRFELVTMLQDLEPHEIGLELTASGDADHATARADLVGRVEEVGELVAELELRYAADSVSLDAFSLDMPETGGSLVATGELHLGEEQRFALEGTWRDLSWPPHPKAPARSPMGTFAASGTMDAYDFRLESAVEDDLVGESQWLLTGSGDSNALDALLAGEALDGTIDGELFLSWAQELSWDFAARAENLNPWILQPELPGQLELAMTSRGVMREEGLVAELHFEQVGGTLLDLALEGEAHFRVAGERYEVRTFDFSAGVIGVTAEGIVDEEWALRWEIDIADLAVLEPIVEALAGSLNAHGLVGGARAEPSIAATVAVRNASLLDYEIATLDFSADLDLSDARSSFLNLHTEDIVVGQTELSEIVIDGEGTSTEHEVTVIARAAQAGAVLLAFAGGLEDDERWRGSLHELSIDDVRPGALPGDLIEEEELEEEAPGPLLGQWILRESVPLAVGPDAARLDTACLVRQEGGEVCLGMVWSREDGAEGHLAAAELPLEIASPWIPGVEVEGSLDAVGQAAVGADGSLLRAEGTLSTGPGALRYVPGPDREAVERAFDQLFVEVRGDAQEVVANLLFPLMDGDGLEGELRLVRSPSPEDASLSGRLTGELQDRGLAGILLPDLSDTEGMLTVDLAVGGTPTAPEVMGVLELTDGRADILPAGIRIEEIRFDASSENATRWAFRGEGASGEGQIALEGSLSPSNGPEGEWSAELTAAGEQFEAYNTTLARVVASPDLNARAIPGRVDVGGTVRIPEGRISPRDFEVTVNISPDVRIVRGEDPAEEEIEKSDGPWDVYAEVRVVLGDDVHLDAFGLTGRLSGSLVVDEAPDRETTGRGELEIVDGEYTAFRQTLAIDHGRLAFADGPVTDPGLDVRVTREANGVVAGMDLGGTATQPEAELFSEPSMADAEVLAYLTLGRPMTFASPEEGELLQQAATRAGVAGAQQIADRIGRGVFGLDEAHLETGEGEGFEEALLVVGAQLSPSLHVSYGIGLFEATSVIRIRYDLGERWLLQTESGAQSAVDLLYRVER